MGVTVVVPTVDRVVLLERCLAALAAQQLPADQVVVVHDGDPEVLQLLDRWAGRLPLLVLRSSHRGAAAKRNLGWRAAAHDLVAFTDDDCAPLPGWTAALAAQQADLIAGPVTAHAADRGVSSVFGRTIEIDRPGPYFPTANLAVRAAMLAVVGGFDESLSAGEDTDLAWRLQESGASVVWAADAVVQHAVRAVTFPEHLRSLWRWRSLPAVVHRHPELRTSLTAGVFWKTSHPVALLALVGLAAGTRWRPAAVLALPLLATRWSERGPRFGTQVAVADLAEVSVMVAGSVRHRSVLL